MTTLDADFEDQLAEAMLDGAEKAAEQIGDDLKDSVEQNFRAYASRNDYDISHLWESVEGPNVTRTSRTVTIELIWPELSALFEFGVSPHTISGDLAFFWESPPGGTRPQDAPSFVQTQTVNWGSVTGGINESRAIRNALAELRRELGGL